MSDTLPTQKPLKLDAREEAFALALFNGKSQIAAYKLAFPKSRSARPGLYVAACRLAKKPNIRLRLAELWAPVKAKARLSREEWLHWVEKCATFDPRQMFDSFGNPKEVPELDDAEAAAVGGFEFVENFASVKKEGNKGEPEKIAVGYTKKFKMLERTRALELYGKACSYYAERRELVGPDGQPLSPLVGIKVEFVEGAKKRAPVVVNGGSNGGSEE